MGGPNETNYEVRAAESGGPFRFTRARQTSMYAYAAPVAELCSGAPITAVFP
jgi:hypothetical protein